MHVLQNAQLETIISLGGRSRSGREGRRRRGFRFPSAGCRAGVMRQQFCLLAVMAWLQQSKGVQSVASPHSQEQPHPTSRAPPPAVALSRGPSLQARLSPTARCWPISWSLWPPPPLSVFLPLHLSNTRVTIFIH